MRKKFLLLAGVLMLLILAGCGKETAKVEPVPGTQNAATKIEKNPDDKILVVYFSVPETDSIENNNSDEANSVILINGEILGNTQYVAQIIQQNSGADIFRIEPVTPYPMNHDRRKAGKYFPANSR